VSAERITVVLNGVPVQGAAPDRGPPDGTWTLGTVALFRPRKGLEVLLESLAALRSRGIDVRVRAVGAFETDRYESAILCLVERLGIGEAVDWIGFKRDVGAELARMDLFVLPSLFGEGLPMVVLEAMAAGLPVVATRVEGVPLAVSHRQSGLLVDPGSVSQTTMAIESVISGDVDYVALSRHAHARHVAQFSDKAMAAAVARVYREILPA
jgi:glycosyltransferase involved in cell wall biosynthesis